ncbi:hypothetical protein [Niastella vici]|uniref:hypothetical protein n=1 Tax=Niastella vici TaxID=1703345 RepID=UPI001C1F5207|nr:hypothetical protein [Niastella vici]
MNKSEELNALRSGLLQNDGSWNAGSNLIFELSVEEQNKIITCPKKIYPLNCHQQ